MVEIKTERLVLRRLAMEHAPDVAATLNNFEVGRFLSQIPYPYHQSDAVDWIGRLQTESEPKDQMFAILDNAESYCGTIGFDPVSNDALLGFYLNQKHWGQGYMSEAASAALEWLFTNSDVQNVTSGAYTYNPASLAIQYKLGFKDVRTEDRMCLAQGQEFPLVVTQLGRENFKKLH